MNAEHVNVLKQADMFFDLSPAQLEMVAAICEQVVFSVDDIVFEENSAGSELYVIARGEVEICVDPSMVQSPSQPARANLTTIATLRRGQTFGEVALVDQGLRSASARCTASNTRLLIIPRERLIALCDANPDLGYRLMRNIAADLAFKIRGADLSLRAQVLWQPRGS